MVMLVHYWCDRKYIVNNRVMLGRCNEENSIWARWCMVGVTAPWLVEDTNSSFCL